MLILQSSYLRILCFPLHQPHQKNQNQENRNQHTNKNHWYPSQNQNSCEIKESFMLSETQNVGWRHGDNTCIQHNNGEEGEEGHVDKSLVSPSAGRRKRTNGLRRIWMSHWFEFDAFPFTQHKQSLSCVRIRLPSKIVFLLLLLIHVLFMKFS